MSEEEQQTPKKRGFNSFRGKVMNVSKNSKYLTKKITVENLVECYNKGLLIG